MAQQVCSEQVVAFGRYETLFWNWSGDNSKVPANFVLEIGAITLNYFPTAGGYLGRADVAGRDAANTAVWRTQIVYVEPKKTVHLAFPTALRLEADGHVEIGFVSEGPGEIFISLNGILVPA